MTNHILVTTKDNQLHLQINRPKKKNALTLAMYATLANALEQAETDETIRVITITGTGDSFTSGNDILDFIQNPPTNENSPVARFLTAITQAQKPIVAAVNGLAIGIGTTMLLHCDLAYATEEATFALPFVNLGLVPEAGSSLLLPLMMGHRHAAELLMLGDPFTADVACEIGLVNQVCPQNELLDLAYQKANQLATKPPTALQITKMLMKHTHQTNVANIMRLEGQHFLSQLQSAEAMQALQAFMQRKNSTG